MVFIYHQQQIQSNGIKIGPQHSPASGSRSGSRSGQQSESGGCC